MTRSEFARIATERDIELAAIIASLHNVCPAQIELWTLQVRAAR